MPNMKHIANLLIETADLLDESSGSNGIHRRIFMESDEYISKKDYDKKKAELLKKQSHVTRAEDMKRISKELSALDKKRDISKIIVDKAKEKDLIKENQKLTKDLKNGAKHSTRDMFGKANVHDTLDARSAHQIDPTCKKEYGERRPVYRDEKDPRILYSGKEDLETMNKAISRSKALAKVDKLNKEMIKKEQKAEDKTSVVNANINRRSNNESVNLTLMLEAAELLAD